jgi:hypothetical protein
MLFLLKQTLCRTHGIYVVHMKLFNLINVTKISHLNMIDYDYNVIFDDVKTLQYLILF